ncbi:zinc finger protein 142-like [Leguminivora glycinivorella]|uniref:zinc finger protein 142-like n=1 Tax=Leguminivora glycinivorella TaxID=1035111 RepID=UPI00200C68B1|nr:zinc finger protein 142-like [Leguminivora glycinivorella]
MSDSPSPEETKAALKLEEMSPLFIKTQKEEPVTDEEMISEDTDNESATENIIKSEKLEPEDMLEREDVMMEKEDMMSMFASVWVKVEVEEARGEELQINESTESPEHQHLPKKRPKNLMCDQCDYRTANRNCLELHLLRHKTGMEYSCHACDYKSKYQGGLRRHVAIRHPEMKGDIPTANGKPLPLHLCSECNYKTFYKWNLSSHKRKHKLLNPFKCDFPDCNFETFYRHNYIKHSRAHTQSVAFKCDKCPFTTKFEGHITRHLEKVHNEVTEKAYKCDMCDFSTKNRWRLTIHVNRMKKGEALKCDFCAYETLFVCAYKKHKVEHYDEISDRARARAKKAKQQNIQEAPENTQTDLDDFENDIEDVPSEPNYKKYNLNPNCVDFKNIQVLETDDQEKPFQCHMCAYASKFKASVQRHFQRNHTGSHNRPYQCVNCDFSTKTKDQIALHNKRSFSDKKLCCTDCKFKTSYKCQFAVHQKCHFLYQCTICSYTCKRKYELQRHYGITHLGIGIKCRFCDFKSSRKDSILRHETRHTGSKPFQCEHCDYKSVRKSLLDKHVKRCHSHVKKVTIVSESKIQNLKIPLVLQKPVDVCQKNELKDLQEVSPYMSNTDEIGGITQTSM